MIEFINDTFQLVNLPATVLLLFCLLYWSMVILGAIGIDAVDLDFDGDFDADFDIEGDIDSSSGGFSSLAEFLHLNDVPIVIVASVFAILFWTASFMGNNFLNPAGNLIFGLGLMAINVPVCLVLTRLIIGPFAEGFKDKETDKVRETMIGLIGKVTTSEITPEFGQVSIRQDGPELVINAVSEEGKAKLGKGDAARIVAYDYERDIYLVELCKWENK